MAIPQSILEGENWSTPPNSQGEYYSYEGVMLPDPGSAPSGPSLSGGIADYQPTSAPSPEWSAAAVLQTEAAYTQGGTQVKTRGIIILGFLLLAAMAFGQTDNTLYVKQFQGATVGQKLTNAMVQCNANTAIPCILVLDPSLAAWPVGSLPAMCSQCSLSDFRAGGPAAQGSTVSFAVTNGVVNPCAIVAASADLQLSAALALVPNGGTIDARCYGLSTPTIANTLYLGTASGGVGKVVDWQFSHATHFKPANCSETMFVNVLGSNIYDLVGDVTPTCPGTTSWTGIILQTSPTGGNGFFQQRAILRGIELLANPFGTTGLGWYAVTPDGTDFISEMEVSNMYIAGPGTCWDLETSGSGWFNANTIQGHFNCQTKGVEWNAGGNGGVGSNETITGNDIQLVLDGTTMGMQWDGPPDYPTHHGNIQDNKLTIIAFDFAHSFRNNNPDGIFNQINISTTGAGDVVDTFNRNSIFRNSGGAQIGSGPGAPSGTCSNGSLWQNASATTQATAVYRCFSNAWAAIP